MVRCPFSGTQLEGLVFEGSRSGIWQGKYPCALVSFFFSLSFCTSVLNVQLTQFTSSSRRVSLVKEKREGSFSERDGVSFGAILAQMAGSFSASAAHLKPLIMFQYFLCFIWEEAFPDCKLWKKYVSLQLVYLFVLLYCLSVYLRNCNYISRL